MDDNKHVEQNIMPPEPKEDEDINIDSSSLGEPIVTTPEQEPVEEHMFTNPLSGGKRLEVEDLLDDTKGIMSSLIRDKVKTAFLNAVEEFSIDDLSVEDGLAIMHHTNTPDDTRAGLFKRKPDELLNHMKYGETIIKPRVVNAKHNGDIHHANIARLKAFKALGLAGRTSIPLINSGFWITLEAIGDRELLDLEYRLTENDVTLGRKTNGAIYSNDSIIYEQIIKEFVEENMTHTTLDVPLDSVFNHVVSEDIDCITVGLAYMLFPLGFDMRLPCKFTHEIDEKKNKIKCNNIYNFKVDPTLMLNGIGEKITSKHLKILGEVTPNSVSINDIAEYKREGFKESLGYVTLELPGDTVTINFKSPSFNDKIKSGLNWVEIVNKQTEDIMTLDASDVDRSLALDKYGQQSRLNTYIHYVDSVVYSDGSKVSYEDSESMVETLSSLTSSDQDIINTIAKGVAVFIKDKTMHTFGVPEFICSTCNGDNNSGSDDFTSDVIPMDPLRVFFQLATVKRATTTNKAIF